MPTYVYTGLNTQGYPASGATKQNTEADVRIFLDNRGISGYAIFESQTEIRPKLYALVSPSELSLFAKQMSVLFFSHMTLMEGMKLL